jgi:hypothetical protein
VKRPKAVVHDFTERLEFSQTLTHEPAFIEFWRRIWPDMTACVRLDVDSQLQRKGADRAIFRANCVTPIYVDEKVRDTEYDDLLVEEFSVFHADNDPRNRTGWTLDSTKICQYVGYVVPKLSRCFFLPFEPMRLACLTALPAWKKRKSRSGERVYPIDSQNHGYVTRNCAVLWSDFKTALGKQLLRRFGSSEPLPLPKRVGDQLVIDWATAKKLWAGR